MGFNYMKSLGKDISGRITKVYNEMNVSKLAKDTVNRTMEDVMMYSAPITNKDQRRRLFSVLHDSYNITPKQFGAYVKGARKAGEDSLALPFTDAVKYRYTQDDGLINSGRLAVEGGIAAGAAAGLGATVYGAAHYFGDDD